MSGHFSQLYGLIPKCRRMCVFKFEVELNIFRHSLQVKGFSPGMKIQRYVIFVTTISNANLVSYLYVLGCVSVDGPAG